jgi:hypothetical protein
MPRLGRYYKSSNLNATSHPQAVPRLFDTAQESRIVFKTKVEPSSDPKPMSRPDAR